MITIESFSRNKNLNARKNWLKKTNPVRTTAGSSLNHYACNRPASWPLNVRQATKIKINIVRVYNSPQYNLPARKKKKKKISDG